MRRQTYVLGSAALVFTACAVTWAPGDYGSASTLDGGGASPMPDAPITSVDAAPLPDAASAVARHLVVIAGERDGSDPLTNDVWQAPIDARGELGAFEQLPPGYFRGPVAVTNVAGGRLFALMKTSARYVEHIPFPPKAHEEGREAWRGTVAPQPGVIGYGSAFSGTNLLAIGGGDAGAGRYNGVQISSFESGAFGPLKESATKLPVGIRDMSVVTYKDFVYLTGGDNGTASLGGKVYVARIDAAAGVGAFTSTIDITTPTGPYTAATPILCAAEGRMFVIGGVKTDMMVMSSINEADGTLSAWQPGPELPGGELRGAGCAGWDGKVHLIGGVGAGPRTDVILRAALLPDNKLGAWETLPMRLPAARSAVKAFVY